MNAPELKNLDHASSMMKLQNAVASTNLNKANQRSNRDKPVRSNAKADVRNDHTRKVNIWGPHTRVQELGKRPKRMETSVVSVTIEKLLVGHYDDINISLPNLNVRNDKYEYKCVSFSDSHTQMINHSVLHRQPMLLTGILAQWGASIIDPSTFSSSFLTHNQFMTDRVLRFMENVIDMSCDVTAVRGEILQEFTLIKMSSTRKILLNYNETYALIHTYLVNGPKRDQNKKTDPPSFQQYEAAICGIVFLSKDQMLNADYDQYIYATGSGDLLHLPGTRVTLDIDEFAKGKFVEMPNFRVHSAAQISRTIEINRGDCIKQIPLLTVPIVSSLKDIDISEISSGGKFVSEKDRIAFRSSQTKRPAPAQKATPPPKKEGKSPKKEKNQDPNSSAKSSASQNKPPPTVPEFFSTNTSNEQGTSQPSPDEISLV